MLSRFHLISERLGQTDRRTDRQTDGRTNRIAISISGVSVMTRDKIVKLRLGERLCPECKHFFAALGVDRCGT